MARSWWRRESLLAGAALLLLTALAWAYTLQGGSVDGMPTADEHAGMAMPGADALDPPRVAPFLLGWAVMMVAMMLPAALPLVLLYRVSARRSLPAPRAAVGVAALLAGYVAVWTLAGLPVYGYARLAAAGSPAMALLPGALLVLGGVYQFTALKRACHTRCSSPLFFLMREWRPGVPGAARLGVLHGVDCLGCCAGLMLALVALGMMNVAWMLTAAVIIFVEKTLPGGHRVARPLGVALVAAGLLFAGGAL